jgi:hypothetical protein
MRVPSSQRRGLMEHLSGGAYRMGSRLSALPGRVRCAGRPGSRPWPATCTSGNALRAAPAARNRIVQPELARAKVQARERFYGKELERQALAFERWVLLTAYCDRLEAHLHAVGPEAPGTESARSWFAWAREHTTQAFSQFNGLQRCNYSDSSIRVKVRSPGME